MTVSLAMGSEQEGHLCRTWAEGRSFQHVSRAELKERAWSTAAACTSESTV